MNQFERKPVWAERAASTVQGRFMSKVYTWMTLGIFLTGIISWEIGRDRELVLYLMSNSILFFGLFIVQIVTVITLAAAINKISSTTAILIFFLYAMLTGVTFSTIFIAYTEQSIELAFLVTTIGFAGLSLFGWVTKRDLGPVGTFCHMALWGLIALVFVSFFAPNLFGPHLNIIYGIGGLVIFSGLTAYDTQRIKTMSNSTFPGSEQSRKAAIHGALVLYLDFINMFLSILALFGGGRRR